MGEIHSFGDIREENGKTIRENNAALMHVLREGDLVEADLEIYDDDANGAEIKLKGTCRMYVVELMRDCDGSPMYMLASRPVRYPRRSDEHRMAEELVYARFVRYTAMMGEQSIRPLGKNVQLFSDVRIWLNSGG